MASCLSGALVKQGLRQSLSINKLASKCLEVPKGYLAVYIGEMETKRFVVPISYLNHPAFQGLHDRVKEEFSFDHSMGGLKIPDSEDLFIGVVSSLNK